MATIFRHFQSSAWRICLGLAVSVQVLGQPAPIQAESPDEITRLRERVLHLLETSKYLEGMPLAERLVSLTTKQHGETSLETADALHHWAWIVQTNGDFEKAEELWLKALAIDEKLFGKDTIQTTRRLHLLANLYRDQGEYERAAPLLERALAIREKEYGPDHPETAQVVKSLGSLFKLSGDDFAAAEANFLHALSSFEKAGHDYWRPTAVTLSDLGWLYFNLGDSQRAKQMLRRSLDLWRRGDGGETDFTAHLSRGLAIAHRHQGELDEAESLLRESLAWRERSCETNHVLMAGLLQDLGETCLAKHDLANAEAILQRSRAIVEMNLDDEHPQVASVLMALSNIKERHGEYAAARELCERALHIREKHFGPSHPRTFSSLRRVAFLEAILGRPQRALATADQIQDDEERALANILSFTSERQRLTFQEDRLLSWRPYGPWAYLGAVQPLARTILRTKGIVLDSLLEDRALAEASRDEHVRGLANELTQVRRRLAQAIPPLLAQDAMTAGRRVDWEALAENGETLEASVARRVTGLGRVRRALSVQVDQVRSAIPGEKTALLEFIRYRHYAGKGRWQARYGVLILSRNAESRWVSLGDAKDIEKSVKLNQHAVRSPATAAALVESLRKLYEQIWNPLAQELPVGTKRVIVSPDGELNFVSFATLLTPANCFLGEKYLFSYVSSSRDLLVENNTPLGPSRLLVWANPDFGAAVGEVTAMSRSVCNGELRDLNFRPLPGAEKEGRLLCEQARELGFDEALLYVGSQATEAELHRAHTSKTLHLATHGFVLPPIEGSGECSKDSEHNEIQARLLPELNPMLRSGLALAGAQRTLRAWTEGKTSPADDDGIVTADEIGGLDLRGTWLVVLSACDTGKGEARAGEGVLGLRRGFIQAGAQNLLLTLWPIDDEETVGLMPEFYAEMQKTRSAALALARVQRSWLQKLRKEKGIAEACRIAGPFILSFQGKPEN